MTWRDYLKIGLWITTPLFGGGLLLIGSAKSQWNHSIDDRLAKWQQAYHLSEETVKQFRLIELEFHGSGNPFTSPIHRSPQEVQIHHQQMAEIIGEPEGKVFLKDINSGRWKH
ncbi:MAG: hypothetical protein RLZZ179_2321 [Verrucomicrobiota bacterium]